ncbi:MAG: RNA polymerase factor sigma-54, partial [Thiovulaceae bacterium]|nr:RNA polymerase factor sigma-54 [Sulfurimonadaceae bacterium]
MKLRQSVDAKQKLSSTLRNWLPILHASLSDLEDSIAPMLDGNVVAQVRSGFEENFSKKFTKNILNGNAKNSQSEHIEALTIQKQSIYEVIEEQITSTLFPTPVSLEIAYKVLEGLSSEGYYEGDSAEDALTLGISEEQFESVRKRFAYLDPVGIGSKEYKESFYFQLLQSDIPTECFDLASEMIENLETLASFSKDVCYEKALQTIQGFSNPPAMEYFAQELEVIPDLYIFTNAEGGIEVELNDKFYPTIEIDQSYGLEHSFITEKIKEAKSLVDALDMRKATLYKVGLMIVEYQYEFFTGGDMKPMTLKTLADEFGHNPSTISRAIANKYICCDRGSIPMKNFFTTALDDDVSNDAVKKF